jgi:hypothetical protein
MRPVRGLAIFHLTTASKASSTSEFEMDESESTRNIRALVDRILSTGEPWLVTPTGIEAIRKRADAALLALFSSLTRLKPEKRPACRTESTILLAEGPE